MIFFRKSSIFQIFEARRKSLEGGFGDPSGLAVILFLAGKGGGGMGGNDDANDSGRGGNAGTLRLDNIAECGRPADV